MSVKDRFCFFLIVVFCSKGVLATDLASLNKHNSSLGLVQVVVSDFKHSWINEGKYASDKGVIDSDNLSKEKNGVSALFDGIIDEGSNCVYSQWKSGLWATLLIEFENRIDISMVSVWTKVGKEIYTESFEVLTSCDLEDFESHGVFNNKIPFQANSFVRLDAILKKSVNAKYIKIRIKRDDSVSQQQIGEVAIWMSETKDLSIESKSNYDAVVFETETFGCSNVFLDWSNYINKNIENVVAWKIYKSSRVFSNINEKGVELVKVLPGNTKEDYFLGFEPQVTVFFAISAVYDGNGFEYPEVKSVKCTLPDVFEKRVFGDILAVNHYPYGGNNRSYRKKNEQEWQLCVLDLLAKTPLKEIRWFYNDSIWINRFASHRISKLGAGRLDPKLVSKANQLGIYSFIWRNEPELIDYPVEKYVQEIKELYTVAKEVNSKNKIAAGSINTDLSSLEWLDKMYQAGAKNYFDVLEIHSYCKISGGHITPDGIPAGAPEALFYDMSKVREIMAKYGDENKPIISTEFGWCPVSYDNPAGVITRKMQSEYLVRGFVLSDVLDLKRVYWYCFIDNGDRPDSREYNWGLVDYYLQAKPAYHSLCTLGEQLGRGILVGKLKGAENPIYGYVYNLGDEYVNVLWNASNEFKSLVEVSTLDKKNKIVDIYGQEYSAVSSDGKFKLSIGTSPVYVHSSKPLKFSVTKNIKIVNEGFTVDIDNNKVVLLPNEKYNYPIKLNNGLEKPVDGVIYFKNEEIGFECQKRFVIKPKESLLEFLEISSSEKKPDLKRYELTISYNTDENSNSYNRDIYVRTLASLKSKKQYEGVMEFDDIEIAVIANSQIEIGIIPSLGCRIIEFFDKKSMKNQIVTDYSIFKKIKEFTFSYNYWDSFGDNYLFKNNKFDHYFDSSSNSIRLFCSSIENKIALKKVFEINEDETKLRTRFWIKNNSVGPIEIKYYGHPEYQIGGTSDHMEDFFILPSKKGMSKLPYWAGLGQRSHPALNQHWAGVWDSQSNTALIQNFDAKAIKDIRIWMGDKAYNLELIGNEIVLKSLETLEFENSLSLEYDFIKN